jgi:hypothetical protein
MQSRAGAFFVERDAGPADLETQNVAVFSIRSGVRGEHFRDATTSRDHGCTRAIAEQDAGVAILPVHEPAEQLHADDQNLPVRLRCPCPRHVEREHEPRATTAAQVVRRDLAGAETRLEEGCRGR